MTISVSRLYQAAQACRHDDPSTSRTARLLGSGRAKMAKKLAEEAVEVVIDCMHGDRESVVKESADLIYNLVVLWVISSGAASQTRSASTGEERRVTSSTARSGSMLLRQKLMPPGLPSAVIARPRLDDLYLRLLTEHDALAVFAAPGSGKTVQTQQFATREEWPLAWLTLDSADRSASRVLSYLAEGLRPSVSEIDEILGVGLRE